MLLVQSVFVEKDGDATRFVHGVDGHKSSSCRLFVFAIALELDLKMLWIHGHITSLLSYGQQCLLYHLSLCRCYYW